MSNIPEPNPEMCNWMAFEFPVIKNINSRTLSDSIEPVAPMEQPPIEKQYENHHGDIVTKYKGSMFAHISSTQSNHMYGDRGHAFGKGWYIVNEDLQFVYSGSEEYDELFKKCNDFWKVLSGLQKRFKGPDYYVERGRGDRIVVNDKIIKGPLIHPGMLRGRDNVDEIVDGISEFIQNDIDRGRIIAGEFGIEK